MRALVTGGAGFIGSHIAEELVRRGHEVVCLDDLSAGTEKNIPQGSEFLYVDVSKKSLLEGVFSKFRPQVVYHQAASKKNICLNNPVRDMEVNIQGTYNIATLCKQYRAKMMHASTGSVYGEPRGRQHERHPINPVSYYGISKFAGERYASLIANAVILRYFHVYGARQDSTQDKGGVIAIWKRLMEEGKPITIFGDGTQTRSFTYVKDIVKANLLDLQPGVYNCVSNCLYMLKSLVKVLEEELQITAKVEYADWLEGDVKDCLPATALRQIQWRTLPEGLKDMMS